MNVLLTRWVDNLPCRSIEINHAPYLYRYYLCKLFGITFYLHQFVSGDDERWLHDHPWAVSVSLILCGGYNEQILDHFDPQAHGFVVKHKRRRARRFNLITKRKLHRILSPIPGTWTLFMHTKRIKSWGFIQRTRVDGQEAVLYHQPLDVSALEDWHRHAKSNADVRSSEGI